MNLTATTTQILETTTPTKPVTVTQLDNQTLTTTSIPVANQTEKLSRKRREDIAPSEFDSPYAPFDGFLDEKANYTAFIEVMGKTFITLLKSINLSPMLRF